MDRYDISKCIIQNIYFKLIHSASPFKYFACYRSVARVKKKIDGKLYSDSFFSLRIPVCLQTLK